MKHAFMIAAVAAGIACAPLAAHALTFKKGQVLGSDGQIYDGASPVSQRGFSKMPKTAAKRQGCLAETCSWLLAKTSPLSR